MPDLSTDYVQRGPSASSGLVRISLRSGTFFAVNELVVALGTALTRADDFFALIAQAVPAPTSDIITQVFVSLGAAGLPTGILWKLLNDRESRHERELTDMRERHQTERKEWRETDAQLEERLFVLANRGMEVGKAGMAVARNPSHDHRLDTLLEQVASLIAERGA